MKTFLSLGMVLGLGAAGGGATTIGNGDVNGDGTIDISDAVYLFSSLFLGGPAPKAIECPAPSGKGLPATGQTRCYDAAGAEIPCDSTAFPGQDGFYKAGCPGEGRFADEGDGTVTDTCTGLIWQKDTADVDGNGSIGAEDSLDWQGALKYCESLNFRGHADWRLPNLRELQSIVDYGRLGPAIDPVFGAVLDSYWSSSSNAQFLEVAWSVLGGGLGYNEKVDHRFVRAVRGTPKRNGDVNGDGAIDISDGIYLLSNLFTGGPPPVAIGCPAATLTGLPATGQSRCFDAAGAEIPCDSASFPGQDGFYKAGCPGEGRFVDHRDGTVTDTCTGLMWQKDTADVNGNGSIGAEDRLDWRGALKYCEGLSFEGHDDWRLPNVRELQSIFDYNDVGPAMNRVFPFQTAPDWYWSSSSYGDFPDWAWSVSWGYGFIDTLYGVVGSHQKTSAVFVRAVRNAP